MRDLERGIKEELRRIAQAQRTEYETALTREKWIRENLNEALETTNKVNRAQVGLRGLESRAQAYRAIYENFLRRYMETTNAQSFPTSEARIISPAATSTRTHPNVNLVLFASVFFGVIAGTGAALLRERMDQVFRTARQAEELFGIPVLGMVPRVAQSGADRRPTTPAQVSVAIAQQGSAGDQRTANPARVLDATTPTMARYAVDQPLSSFAEALRRVKVELEVAKTSVDGHVIGVTSALPNEGKSTVAANLAHLMASSGLKVLLIDGDARNPGLSRELVPAAQEGLLELLHGRAKLPDVVWSDTATSLSVIPVVTQENRDHAKDMVGSPMISNMLTASRSAFDFVIVDLPPLTPVADARAIVPHVDALLLVLEWGRTHIDIAGEAVESSTHVRDKISGVVLNKVNLAELPKYESYKGSRYYRNYYGRYGYTE
jgi:succinoglycan biosynthesis transport protein ExoP